MNEWCDAQGMHCHKCGDCGTVWQHPEGGGGGDDPHACPKPGCKGRQCWKMLQADVTHIDYPWAQEKTRRQGQRVGAGSRGMNRQKNKQDSRKMR